MNTKKTAHCQTYDPSMLEMSESCVRQDMCDDIADLEDDIFDFGKDMIKLSKSLDSLDKQEIAKYCISSCKEVLSMSVLMHMKLKQKVKTEKDI